MEESVIKFFKDSDSFIKKLKEREREKECFLSPECKCEDCKAETDCILEPDR